MQFRIAELVLIRHWTRILLKTCMALAAIGVFVARTGAREDAAPPVIDLSVLVAPDLPCTWPSGFPPFQISHYLQIGPLSSYSSDLLILDENTGTQFDAPTHSVAPPDSGRPNAGRFGSMSSDKVPTWQFAGEACVIDVGELLNGAPNGRSSLIRKRHVVAWEKEHRPLSSGDVVLFSSGFSDRYYKPFPEGRRFLADCLEGKVPGWPDPDPECMEYLASRNVMTLGTDSPSMGPIPDLAEPTHFAGLRHGMIWTESATGLSQLPPTSAFYCMLAPKYAGGIGGPVRAFAIVEQPLASRLIQSARKKNILDLTTLLSPDLPVSWPGRGVGNARYPYYSNAVPPHFQNLHMMDSNSGTHLVPPAYALPGEDFDNEQYSPEVQDWLAEYERRFGPRGTSNMTVEKVPISRSCGPARVIDVAHLSGSTRKASWPASPEIRPATIKRYEEAHGALRPGDIVIFHSSYSDRHCKPFPAGNTCLTDPLNGKSEGWPAPGPEAILYLHEKGIRCVATDGPTLGGVEPKRALMTYWALGSKGMVGVEYLTNVETMPEEAYFLFAALKIRSCHGGPGRAIALY